MSHIVTLTINPAIDRSVSASSIAPEIKLYCHDERRDAGGGGINVSRAIKRLGGDSLAVYPSGGITGDLLQQLLDAEGIRQNTIAIQQMTRENFTAYDETTTLQYRFGMPGAALTTDEIEACLTTLRQLDPAPDFLVASGSLAPNVPDDFYQRVGEVTQSLGAKYVLDAAGVPLQKAVEAGNVYLIKPNFRELKGLAGLVHANENQHEETAHQLVAQGKVQVVVVSLGAAGALLVTADGSLQIPAPVVPIQSKVGAGDSMVGGILYGLSQDFSLREAVRYGVATGAATVMTPGTQLCQPDDVERLYISMSHAG